MMTIELSKKCQCCGRGGRTLDVKHFKKETFKITESVLKMWDTKCCWKCKKKPQLNEVCGMVNSHSEPNRIFCPVCSEYVEERLKEEKIAEKVW